MRKLFESRVAAVAVGATVIVGLGATGATAAGMIGSDQIDNQSIKAVDIDRGAIGPSELRRGSVRSSDINPNTIQTDDINDGAIAFRDLRPWVKDHVTNGEEIRGLEDRVSTLETTQGEGSISGLESDGPYPGATELQEGDNSTQAWLPGELSQSWVMCAPDKVALGGGFTLASDDTLANKLATEVVTSQPVQIVDGNPAAYTPIEGDPDGSFVPNGWLVEGVYTGTDAEGVVVRPHVVCAEVEDAEAEETETEGTETE